MPRDEEWLGAETAQRIYTNNVQIGTSDHDVRFRLGVIVEATAERIVTDVEADVYMSRAHAVALATRLNEVLGLVSIAIPEPIGAVN